MSAAHTMAGDKTISEPRQAIERSRSELLRFLSETGGNDSTHAHHDEGWGAAHTSEHQAVRDHDEAAIDWGSMLRAGVSAWWSEHPLRSGVTLLKPGVEDFVRRKPFQTIAVAAVAGAALVLIRPWRLISVSAIALSLYRSSNLAGMATSLFATAAQSLQKERSHESAYRS